MRNTAGPGKKISGLVKKSTYPVSVSDLIQRPADKNGNKYHQLNAIASATQKRPHAGALAERIPKSQP